MGQGPTVQDPRANLASSKGTITFTNYKDADGLLLAYPRSTARFRADGAITLYDWVVFVAATSTVPLSVKRLVAAEGQDLAAGKLAGVALNAAAAGESVEVCVWGVTLCNIGNTGTIALGDLAIPHASTNGASGVVASSAIGTTTVGHFLGRYLGPEVGTTDTAPVFVWPMISSGIS